MYGSFLSKTIAFMHPLGPALFGSYLPGAADAAGWFYEVIQPIIKTSDHLTFEMSIFFYGAHFMLVAAYGPSLQVTRIDSISSQPLSKRNQMPYCPLYCYLLYVFPVIFVLTYFGRFLFR